MNGPHPASVFAHAQSLDAHRQSSAANDMMTHASHQMAADSHKKAAAAHMQASHVMHADSTQGPNTTDTVDDYKASRVKTADSFKGGANPGAERRQFIKSGVDSTPSDVRKSFYKVAGTDTSKDEMSHKVPAGAFKVSK